MRKSWQKPAQVVLLQERARCLMLKLRSPHEPDPQHGACWEKRKPPQEQGAGRARPDREGDLDSGERQRGEQKGEDVKPVQRQEYDTQWKRSTGGTPGQVGRVKVEIQKHQGNRQRIACEPPRGAEIPQREDGQDRDDGIAPTSPGQQVRQNWNGNHVEQIQQRVAGLDGPGQRTQDDVGDGGLIPRHAARVCRRERACGESPALENGRLSEMIGKVHERIGGQEKQPCAV